MRMRTRLCSILNLLAPPSVQSTSSQNTYPAMRTNSPLPSPCFRQVTTTSTGLWTSRTPRMSTPTATRSAWSLLPPQEPSPLSI
ncbi:hypothetical protein C8R46DRAFT_1095960 [Mycena filopes]|nr:hypothetical protein C8R46DRAFT_1095960 [Mycena filopes]